MVVVENHILDGHEFTRTYSDANRFVVREGVSYGEAWDPAEYGRTYTEGDPIPSEDGEATIEDKAEAYDILIGED